MMSINLDLCRLDFEIGYLLSNLSTLILAQQFDIPIIKYSYNIIFFANSSVDLINLYKVLKSNFNIIWVVYHWKVYKFLKKKNVENIYFINRKEIRAMNLIPSIKILILVSKICKVFE